MLVKSKCLKIYVSNIFGSINDTPKFFVLFGNYGIDEKHQIVALLVAK